MRTRKVAIEIFGGPEDGAILTVEIDAQLDPRRDQPGLPRLHYAGAPVRQRPDGRLYIDWHEATGLIGGNR